MIEPIQIKQVLIDGKFHDVKVYPASPVDVEPEVVWAKPRHGAHISKARKIALADGSPAIVNTLSPE